MLPTNNTTEINNAVEDPKKQEKIARREKKIVNAQKHQSSLFKPVADLYIKHQQKELEKLHNNTLKR